MPSILRAILAVSLFTACKPKPETSLKISGGGLSYNHPFVQPIYDSKTGAKFCSSVFIEKKVALSAAHCFADSAMKRTPPLVINDKGLFAASKVYVPQAFTSNNSSDHYAYDFAVIVFDQAITDAVIAVKTSSSLAVGDSSLRAIGFGCNRTAASFMKPGSALLRAYEQGLIRWMSPEPMRVKSIEFAGKKDANAYEVEGSLKLGEDNLDVMVCPGDSGGALVKGKELVAITSRMFPTKKTSAFTSLSHTYASRIIKNAVSGRITAEDRLHVAKHPDSFKVDEALATRLLSEYKQKKRYLVDNKQAIESELQKVYSEFLAHKKTGDKKRKIEDEIFDQQDRALPVLVKKLNSLIDKHRQLAPKVFVSLARQIPLKGNDPQLRATRSARDHLWSLYGCTAKRYYNAATPSQPQNEAPCAGLSLPFLYDFNIIVAGPSAIELREVGDYGEDIPEAEPGEPVIEFKDQDFHPIAKPILNSLVASSDESVIAAVAAGKKAYTGAVVVPLYTFSFHPDDADFMVVNKVEALVVHGGKIIDKQILYSK